MGVGSFWGLVDSYPSRREMRSLFAGPLEVLAAIGENTGELDDENNVAALRNLPRIRLRNRLRSEFFNHWKSLREDRVTKNRRNDHSGNGGNGGDPELIKSARLTAHGGGSSSGEETKEGNKAPIATFPSTPVSEVKAHRRRRVLHKRATSQNSKRNKQQTSALGSSETAHAAFTSSVSLSGITGVQDPVSPRNPPVVARRPSCLGFREKLGNTGLGNPLDTRTAATFPAAHCSTPHPISGRTVTIRRMEAGGGRQFIEIDLDALPRERPKLGGGMCGMRFGSNCHC